MKIIYFSPPEPDPEFPFFFSRVRMRLSCGRWHTITFNRSYSHVHCLALPPCSLCSSQPRCEGLLGAVERWLRR